MLNACRNSPYFVSGEADVRLSAVAQKVSLSGGPAIQRARIMEEAEGGAGGGGALDTDLIEYYQLLADKGDVQAQVRRHLVAVTSRTLF